VKPNTSVNNVAPKASAEERLGTPTIGKRIMNRGEKNSAPPIPRVIVMNATIIMIGNKN
jgi:hypothetical protein